MMAQELDVFYNGAEFAKRFSRTSTDKPAANVLGIFSVVDQEALDGYALSAQYELRYVTAAIELHAGDELTITEAGIAARYQLRGEPVRVNDGLESTALLTKMVVKNA